MRESKLLSLLLALLTALFILTASIAVPILFRPFYYAQIGPLGLEESTGLTREEIITAYDETVDFCIGLRREFSTGSLAWSESGRDHFVDVRGLFQLDLAAAALSGLALAAWLVIKRKAAVRPFRFRGRGPGFWGCAGLGALFLLVGGLAAADFQRAFVLFHALFFPGKDNWIFDARADQVILILPEAFFRNCAILILALIVLACAGVILADLRRRKR